MDNARQRRIFVAMDADVLIAGGGLNGTALALALASGGLRVGMVEPRPARERGDPGFDGRGYALALGSVRVLGALGLWTGLAERAQPILEVKVSDARRGAAPSPLTLEMHHTEIEEGPLGQMVEDRHLRAALLAAVGAVPEITAHDGRVAAQSAGPAGVAARLEDGRTLRARVLIGCDGRSSATAARAGIRRVGWRYGQTSLVCAIAHARPHGGVAHQLFLPPGPLAILPLPGDRASIVWTERERRAAEIVACDDAGYLAALRPRIGGFLGEIALVGRRFSYPLALSLAWRFVAPRIALAGDAAHAVHPLAGQGLNAGLKDVAALAEVLVEAHRRGEDIGQIDVLERYQRWRRFDATALACATDTFNRLFSNDSGVVRLGRDLGLAGINALPGLRRGLIREAAGLTGDLPRLARGKAI